MHRFRLRAAEFSCPELRKAERNAALLEAQLVTFLIMSPAYQYAVFSLKLQLPASCDYMRTFFFLVKKIKFLDLRVTQERWKM